MQGICKAMQGYTRYIQGLYEAYTRLTQSLYKADRRTRRGAHPAIVLGFCTSILQCSQHLTLECAQYLSTVYDISGRGVIGERDREAKALHLARRPDNALDARPKCHAHKLPHGSARTSRAYIHTAKGALLIRTIFKNKNALEGKIDGGAMGDIPGGQAGRVGSCT
jgi:hypothetical protein